MSATTIPVILSLVLSGSAASNLATADSWKSSTPCTAETDAACPSRKGPWTGEAQRMRASHLQLSHWTQTASMLMLDMDLPPADNAQPAWAQSGQVGPTLPEGRGRNCSGNAERMVWRPDITGLEWLMIRMQSMDSLEPQRCTVSANICLTGC